MLNTRYSEDVSLLVYELQNKIFMHIAHSILSFIHLVGIAGVGARVGLMHACMMWVKLLRTELLRVEYIAHVYIETYKLLVNTHITN